MFESTDNSSLAPLQQTIGQRWRWIIASSAAVVVALFLGDAREIARESGAAFCVGLVIGALWVRHLIGNARTGKQWAFLYLVLPIIVLQGMWGVSDLGSLAGWLGLGNWLLATIGAFYLSVFLLLAAFHHRVEASIKKSANYHV